MFSTDTTLLHAAESFYFPRKISLRSNKTKIQYVYAFRAFSAHLHREATLADLDDDVVTVWSVALLNQGLSAFTVREKVGRITALWNWLARKRIVDKFPTVEKITAPVIQPVAWREDELRRLFDSARKERGRVGGVPADLWWVSHFAFMFCTAERKSAALSVRPEWLDLNNLTCAIPANVRKGGRKPAVYHLWPELADLLRKSIAAMPGRELVWPWDRCEVVYYSRWSRILADAGLPTGRHRKAHSLRCTAATMLAALGGDATRALGHSSPETTQKHYIDTRLMPPEQAKLCIPWQPQ